MVSSPPPVSGGCLRLWNNAMLTRGLSELNIGEW
jgi:hypothetical protein